MTLDGHVDILDRCILSLLLNVLYLPAFCYLVMLVTGHIDIFPIHFSD